MSPLRIPFSILLGTDVSFICVGTPARSNGNQNLDAITRIAEQIGAVLAQKTTRHVVVIRSTVKPGTVEEVIGPALEAASGLQAGVDFSLCFQPEFLREGTSIHDYDHPPLTVVGASDPHAWRHCAAFRSLPCELCIVDRPAGCSSRLQRLPPVKYVRERIGASARR